MEYPLNQSATKRAWQDTWGYLLNSKIGYAAGVVVIGMIASIVVSTDSGWASRLLVGAIGAFLGLIVLVCVTYAIFAVRTPYQQRNEARILAIKLKETLSELDIIDGFLQECSAFLNVDRRNSISTGFPLPDQILVDHRIWFRKISDWIAQRTYPEGELWKRIVDIEYRQPDHDDLIRRYELGYDVLRRIKVSIQLASRKGGSQKQ